MGERWTDERLDDFRGDVDRRFDEVDKRFDRLEDKVDRGFSEVNHRIDGLQRTMLLTNGGIIATLLAAVLAAIFGVGQL